jgi:hypothetical protein
MRTDAALLFFVPVLLSAQTLDGGRLDPAWFGPAAQFLRVPRQGFQWVKPGTSFRGRTLRIQEWEPAVWLGRTREGKDRAFADQARPDLRAALERGLRQGFAGTARLSTTEGDVLVVGRVVDAAGEEQDATFSGAASLTLDLKLVDAVSGELLAAFHHTVVGEGERDVLAQFGPWCVNLGSHLAEAGRAPGSPPVSQPPRPVLELAATLRRLEALRHDGVLTEEGFQALQKKAREMAGKQ